MRKPGITILLLLYAFTQLGTIAWYYSKPVIHLICYSRLRFRSVNKNDENECIIKMNPVSFKKAQQGEHEILWKGEVYDVKSVNVNGDEVIVTAEKDITETNWMEVSRNTLQRITNNKWPMSSAGMRFFQWMFKLYLPNKCTNLSVTFLSLVVQNNLYSCHNLFPFSEEGPYQPPDLIS